MIDRERVNELRHEIGEEDFSEVAEMFLDEMADSISALRNATINPGPAVFHGLRGSALNLGFTDFAKACTTAEKWAEEGRTVDLVHLDWLFQESVKAFTTDPAADAA